MIKYFLLLVGLMSVLPLMQSCKDSGKDVAVAAHQESTTWQDVTIDQALANEDAVLLDVRTPEEVSQGIIPGAIHIDVKNSNFKVEVAKLDKAQTYMVYCRSGGRSKTASDIMVNLGFEEVNNVLGGYNGYVDSEHYTSD